MINQINADDAVIKIGAAQEKLQAIADDLVSIINTISTNCKGADFTSGCATIKAIVENNVVGINGMCNNLINNITMVVNTYNTELVEEYNSEVTRHNQHVDETNEGTKQNYAQFEEVSYSGSRSINTSGSIPTSTDTFDDSVVSAGDTSLSNSPLGNQDNGTATGLSDDSITLSNTSLASGTNTSAEDLDESLTSLSGDTLSSTSDTTADGLSSETTTSSQSILEESSDTTTGIDETSSDTTSRRNNSSGNGNNGNSSGNNGEDISYDKRKTLDYDLTSGENFEDLLAFYGRNQLLEIVEKFFTSNGIIVDKVNIVNSQMVITYNKKNFYANNVMELQNIFNEFNAPSIKRGN